MNQAGLDEAVQFHAGCSTRGTVLKWMLCACQQHSQADACRLSAWSAQVSWLCINRYSFPDGEHALMHAGAYKDLHVNHHVLIITLWLPLAHNSASICTPDCLPQQPTMIVVGSTHTMSRHCFLSYLRHAVTLRQPASSSKES